MTKYVVEYATDASYDLLSISFGIISKFADPQGAKKTTDGIIAKCERLAIFPKSSPIKTLIQGKEIRFAHTRHFIIMYYISEADKVVVIYRILGSHMDLLK